METMLLISQLAKTTQIPIHTIRYYERYGLFRGKKHPAVQSNNYTWYDADSIEKLQLVKEAKEIGFSLSEIKTLIDAWYSNRLSKEKKKEILEKKIAEIDYKILHMKKVKKMLFQAIDDVKNDLC